MQTDKLCPQLMPQPRAFAFQGKGNVIDHAMAAELEQLAARISRIRPISHTNPHAFYEERSDVASQVRAIAARMRCPDQVAPSDAAEVPAPIGRQVERRRVVHTGGRTVLVLERAGVRRRDLEDAAHG